MPAALLAVPPLASPAPPPPGATPRRCSRIQQREDQRAAAASRAAAGCWALARLVCPAAAQCIRSDARYGRAAAQQSSYSGCLARCRSCCRTYSPTLVRHPASARFAGAAPRHDAGAPAAAQSARRRCSVPLMCAILTPGRRIALHPPPLPPHPCRHSRRHRCRRDARLQPANDAPRW